MKENNTSIIEIVSLYGWASGYAYIILHECDVKCQCGKTMMLNDEDFVKPGIIDEDHREISTCSLIVLHSESSTLGHRINLDLA